MSLKTDVAKYKPRKEQRDVMNFISDEWDNNKLTKFFLLNLPPGVGKSHLAMMISQWYQKTIDKTAKIDIITNSKILQDQYANFYESINDLKGKENYECNSYSCSCAQGSEFNRLNKTTCEDCPHTAARESFISGGISLTNFYLYILYAIYTPKLLESRGAKLLIVDECLHPSTDITMSDGSTKKITDIKIGDLVKTINENTNLIEFKEVDYVYENLSKNQQMYELEMENGDILKITGNHKVKLTSGLWKKVEDLTIDDEIINIYEKEINDKDVIYDFIRDNKSKFIYGKTESDRNMKLDKFINDNNIKLRIDDITLNSVFEYLTEHWDKTCENINCNNAKKVIGYFPRRGKFPEAKGYGNFRFCSPRCNYESISIRQMGDNNTSHRMSEETFKGMCRKNSEKMKINIKEGRFIPNVTNSWARSRCDISIIRDGVVINIKTRSTWDAYFQIFNPNLLYEKLIIPYKFKNNHHNYIVDFVDHDNKIIYEVKPDSTSKDIKNLAKEKYARRWCKLNGYKYVMIKNKWFKKNYDKNLVIGQPCEDKLLRNLKQFA